MGRPRRPLQATRGAHLGHDHGRLYDPAVARDRRSLLEDAVDAEYESDKTSERLLRSVRAAAELGKPHGKNLYGYRRVYDPQTRRLLRIEEHPEQAPIVKEAAQRILRGDSSMPSPET